MTTKKPKREIKIEKSMTFAEIIRNFPGAAEILMEKGMHCIGCPMSMHETLEQGASMHGINPEEIVKELNRKLKQNK